MNSLINNDVQRIQCLDIIIKKEEELNNVETQSQDNNDAVTQIKKFKELLDIGAITEEEFNTKKKELLNL